jgi:elongation factor G
VGGVEPQSETVWRQADKYGVPRIAFVNKMDRVGADIDRVVQMMRDRLKARPVLLQLPIGREDGFRGVVDLVQRKAILWDRDLLEAEYRSEDLSADLVEFAKPYLSQLYEEVAEGDDEVMEKYLEGEEIERRGLIQSIRRQCIEGRLIPVFCGSAFRNKGIQPLLDAILDYLPSPLDIPPVRGVDPADRQREILLPVEDGGPFGALAFKIMMDPYVGNLTFFRVYSGTLKAGSGVYNSTQGKSERVGRILKMHANKREEIKEAFAGDIAAAVGLKHTATGDTLCDHAHPIVLETIEFPNPVISIAIEPKSKADQEKLGTSLQKLAMEDPSFRVRVEEETGQTIISGMGELHLEIIGDRLLREFGVEANVGKPQVAYKETIRRSVQNEGRFVRQTGGRGQYGHVVLRVDPVEAGGGIDFEDAVRGGSIPREYISSVEKGVREALETGELAGYPVVDVKVTLLDGSYHEVDSSEIAFKIAGSMAVKGALAKAGPVLLEPIMSVEVVLPEEFLGEVIGDLSSRRGKILGMEARSGSYVVSACAPLAEMFGYATDLRSMTQGRATYTMQFSHYAGVPSVVSEEVSARAEGRPF